VASVKADLPEAFRTAYRQILETNKSQIKGLALDLRFADGFDYAAAAKLADCFLSSDHPLLDWQSGSARATLKTDAITVPVVTMVNAQTTGASEALAAVLRDSDVGLVMGSPTAGAASVYKEFTLHDGTKLRVAVAPVMFGSGKALTNGLVPDIAISTSLEDERAYLQDPYKDLHPETVKTNTLAGQAAEQPRLNEVELIREHNNGDNPDAAPFSDRVEVPEAPVVVDPVLAHALDLLKGMAVFQPNRAG
jgi:C-terminal processing protease CtpA/Prc